MGEGSVEGGGGGAEYGYQVSLMTSGARIGGAVGKNFLSAPKGTRE